MNKRLPTILTCKLSQGLEIILYSRSSYTPHTPLLPVNANANEEFFSPGDNKNLRGASSRYDRYYSFNQPDTSGFPVHCWVRQLEKAF